MKKIIIRSYQKSDVYDLVQIYYNTIHTINIKDYTQEQCDAWAPQETLQVEGWQKKWLHNEPLVAIYDDKIVGFAEFEPSGHIDCFYVHHAFQGQGIGSALMEKIEQIAHQKNISRLFAEVSITAKPFFEKKGFYVVKKQTIVRHGIKLDNFIMEKHAL